MKPPFPLEIVLSLAIGVVASLLVDFVETPLEKLALFILAAIIIIKLMFPYVHPYLPSYYKDSLKIANILTTTDIRMQKHINLFIEKLNIIINQPYTLTLTLSDLYKIFFSTLVGTLSWCYVLMGMLVIASFGTGINERSLEECFLGGLGSFVIAGAIFYLFNKWIN